MDTQLLHITSRTHILRFRLFLVSIFCLIFFIPSGAMQAQQLGWEGETGVFVTPLAYTVATPEHRFALPVVSYHFLNAGSVIGRYNQLSITSGYSKRVEFGYTRTIHDAGSDPTYSPLWTDGFNTIHAKGSLITENAWKQPWMPQVSTGFMLRTQVRNVGGEMENKDTTNADVYLVATKTITQLKPMSLILSGGVQGTNAELIGLGGNASKWGPVGFGAVAVVFCRTGEERHRSRRRDRTTAAPSRSATHRRDPHRLRLRSARDSQPQAEVECGLWHTRRAGRDRSWGGFEGKRLPWRCDLLFLLRRSIFEATRRGEPKLSPSCCTARSI